MAFVKEVFFAEKELKERIKTCKIAAASAVRILYYELAGSQLRFHLGC